jgi:hypothetical protein
LSGGDAPPAPRSLEAKFQSKLPDWKENGSRIVRQHDEDVRLVSDGRRANAQKRKRRSLRPFVLGHRFETPYRQPSDRIRQFTRLNDAALARDLVATSSGGCDKDVRVNRFSNALMVEAALERSSK